MNTHYTPNNTGSHKIPLRFSWRSSAATTQGNVRDHNEDAILDRPEVGLWLVADGMGGHNAGDVASAMIVESLSAAIVPSRLSSLVDEIDDRLRRVNDTMYARSIAPGSAGVMGSTVAVLLAHEHFCLALWAGDSRVYRYRDGALKQISRDHSEVQELIETGALTREKAEQHAASNIITRAVGGTENLCLDLELRELRDNDRYLVCSDGLYKEVAELEMVRCLSVNDPKAACDALLKVALAGQCSDNVSAVVVHFHAQRA